MTHKQIVGRVLVVVLLVIAFVFVLDYIVLRIRMLHATATVPFEHLTRNRLLAIKVKNGTYQYELDEVTPTQALTYVHALFPHYGDPPCWYLKPRLTGPSLLIEDSDLFLLSTTGDVNSRFRLL